MLIPILASTHLLNISYAHTYVYVHAYTCDANADMCPSGFELSCTQQVNSHIPVKFVTIIFVVAVAPVADFVSVFATAFAYYRLG
jgi:hypothetical protein